jgi:hypothetical protein
MDFLLLQKDVDERITTLSLFFKIFSLYTNTFLASSSQVSGAA